MVDGPKNGGVPSQTSMKRGGVNSLAARAISVLSAKGGTVSPDYSSPQLNTICDAFVAPDEEPRREAIALLESNGLTPDDIIEHIIPTVAHLLGERWFGNTLSFADVTIGAARLQETIRSLSRKLDRPVQLNGDCILLVVPRNEHHTLGIFVAAHAFRRLGIDVQLAVGQHPRQVAQLVKKHRFAAVCITASGRRSLAAARDFVETIRSSVPRITPIVVGGSVTMLDLDIKSMTGADHVTSDPQRVIEVCRLETSAVAEQTNG